MRRISGTVSAMMQRLRVLRRAIGVGLIATLLLPPSFSSPASGAATKSARTKSTGPKSTSRTPAATRSADSTNNPFRTGRTLVIPHGGGDGLFPENTLLAYERTMAMGADVIDVDLQLSRDNVAMAIHDGNTKRTTGRDALVSSMTSQQLQKLDAGWSFTVKGQHPFRGKNVRIPTLEEILRRFPTKLLSLDLKSSSMKMVKPVCDLLRKYNRGNDAFVGGNSDPQILAFRQECPDVRTSATMVDVYASQAARDAQSKAKAKDFKPDTVIDQPPYRFGDRILVDRESLDFAHAHGIAILTWVVNDPKDMKTLVELGVDGIYTSYPDRLLTVIREVG